MILNLEKYSITLKNYAVTYYQMLQEVPWLLRLEEKPKNDKNEKNCNFDKKKLLKFVILRC